MTPLDEAETAVYAALLCVREARIGDARFYLHEADTVLAAEEQHEATEPQPFPAPDGSLAARPVEIDSRGNAWYAVPGSPGIVADSPSYVLTHPGATSCPRMPTRSTAISFPAPGSLPPGADKEGVADDTQAAPSAILCDSCGKPIDAANPGEDGTCNACAVH